MSSYYNKVDGSLQTGRTARSDDIHLIQSHIQDAIQRMIVDMFGTGFILGEPENALKLYPTTTHVDQTSLNYNEGACWTSFYDVYLRQRINITKSSIETISVHMVNTSDITTTVYAEIRDSSFNLIQESNAVLRPVNEEAETDDEKYRIDFHFNRDHLPLGTYFFVIRPVDISSADLANSGDIPINTITEDNFMIKYDADGNYNQGLEASYDGATYLYANLLNPLLTVDVDGDELSENNPDLYFEEIYSSGNTYVINQEVAAVILGEKVYPADTHVTIDGPSKEGDRIDLVTLTTDGTLNVTQGDIFTDNSNKKYPTDNTGLNIAYITTFKASKNKVPAIEQSDDNNTTRTRDILERIRRLEKRVNYQVANNSPTRVKYICTVDPVMVNNGVDDKIPGEGSYGVGASTNKDGEPVISTNNMINYVWSIIENNYTYNIETETSENGEIKVWDMFTTSVKDNTFVENQPGLYHHNIEVKDYSEKEAKPVGGLKLEVQVKKGGTLKKSFSVTTNSEGKVNLTLFSLKLAKGTYSIYTIYQNVKIKSKLIVADPDKKASFKSGSPHVATVSIPKVSGKSVTHALPEGVIAGDDSFYKDNVDVDIKNGEIRVKKISNISDEYQINEGRPLLKDTKKYKSQDISYRVKSDKESLTSQYPVLHVTFTRDTYIKKITPYIEGFKNIESFGVLIFKNDTVYNNVNEKRQIYTKKVGDDEKDDPVFPTLFKSKYTSLKDAKKNGDYTILNKPISFDVNKDFEAGMYSIVIFTKLASGQNEGEIKLKEYKTQKDANTYGISTKCVGGSQLSVINMDTNNITDRSWDVAIEHKTYKYYDSGIVQSKPINTGVSISACNITKNFIIPKGCSMKLFVSNNGGKTWISADSDHIIFKSDNSVFRWKIEFTTNVISTPKLKFNNTRQQAISFSLSPSVSWVPYEDYQQCYESPLLNANYITRDVTHSRASNRFSEWEFSRLFIEDTELNSKIDILISYAYDNNNTNIKTGKEKWGRDIFFSTVFADLELSDFGRESIDYDNYEGNVEYDEYNYRFDLDTDAITHETGGLAVAAPTASNSGDNGYIYGDINEISMNPYFTYQYQDGSYTYKGNEDDPTQRHAGMHITDGPSFKAIRTNNSFPEDFSSNNTINGIRFINGLDIDETSTEFSIGIIASFGNNSNIEPSEVNIGDKDPANLQAFPEGTFKIAMSLSPYGQIEEGNKNVGIEKIIDKPLINGQYTEVAFSIADDIEGFSASDLQSIAIKLVDPNNEIMQEGDSIAIGRVTTSSYSVRPYVPYMYTGYWSRLQWKSLVDGCQAFSMYSLGKKNEATSSSDKVFYPIHNQKDDISVSSRVIKTITDDDDSETGDKTKGIRINVDGSAGATQDEANSNNSTTYGRLQVWRDKGTHKGKRFDASNSIALQDGKYGYIERKENHFYTIYKDGENGRVKAKYVSQDTGDVILFQFPPKKTGNLFKIDTNIPYSLYNLIDIEYYIFTRFYTNNPVPNGPEERGAYETVNALANNNLNIYKDDNDVVYECDGSFSKGEIYIDLYDTRDIDNNDPIESFALPSWGRIATRSYAENKVVSAWFNKRSSHTKILSIVIRRENPRGYKEDEIKSLKLVLNNMLFFKAKKEAALGPQMQMRIYPNNMDNTTNTKIRKVGGVYRL